MTSFVDNAVEAARGVACGILTVNDEINRWWAASGLPFLDESAARQASALRRTLCDDPTNVPPSSPPFIGGQCPGVRYSINYTGTVTEESGSTFPVNGNGIIREGPISQEVNVPTGNDLTTSIVGSDGVTIVAIIPNTSTFRFDTFDVTRTDGQPDDCGNPEPNPVGPYVPVTVNQDITYVDNSMNTVVENFDVTLLAPVIVGGVVFAPVTIVNPDVEVNLNLRANGEFNFNFNFRDGNTEEPDQPVPPPSVPDFPEPPQEPGARRIVRVVVSSTVDVNIFRGTILQSNDGPNLYVPRLASVQFYVATGSQFAWTGPIDVQNLQQVIEVPSDAGAVDVAVATQPGVNVNVTRIFDNVPVTVR